MINNAVSQLVVSNSSPSSPRIQQFSAFVDDAWKLTNAVNLSLGMRWEVNPAPTGKNGMRNALTAIGNSLPPPPSGSPRGGQNCGTPHGVVLLRA